MYLIEPFSRLQDNGRDDTVSVYMPSIDPETLSAEMHESLATFMRMAATFAKLAAANNKNEYLEMGCRILNRAMADCTRDDPR
ncbi:MAG TPA: hypothetical protein V6D47_22110 [Oscillatoriaceae cyanobacterium]